jgi:hypothetical protein
MNPAAIHLLEEHPHKIDWQWICQNKNALPIFLKQDPDILDWFMLSENPGAVPLLEQYPNRIHWDRLAFNRNAIHLLTQNLDEVPMSSLANNPNAVLLLCVPDYEKMREDTIVHELNSRVLDPDRVFRVAQRLGLSFHEYLMAQ